MKKLRRIAALLLAMAMVFPLAACSENVENSDTGATQESGATAESAATATEITSNTPVYGGNITMYFREFSADYDPALAGMNNCALWYEKLWNADLNSDITSDVQFLTVDYTTGQIAKEWSFDEASKTLTVEIRDDIYFQEKEERYDIYGGRNLVADDIAWSYRRLVGIDGVEKVKSQQDWAGDLYMLESVSTEGDYTVNFHLISDAEVMVDDFMVIGVNIGGPEWDTLTDDQKKDWHYACGTGAFVLTDYVTDNYMAFAKNEHYYDTDQRAGYEGNRLPYVDTVTFTLYPDTANVMAQFIAGKLDIMYSGSQILTNSQVLQIRDTMNPDDYVEVTTRDRSNGIGLKQNNEVLTNLKVREAMQYAINSAEINADYFGYTTDLVMPGLYAPSTDWSSVDSWDEELKDSYYNYNPEKAKELLAEAGYPDGFEFTIIIIADMDQDLFALAKSYLSQVGITMNIEVVNTPVEMQSAGTSKEDLRCAMYGLGLSGLSVAYSTLHSNTQQDNVWASLTDGGKLDSMFDAINVATSTEERVKLAQELDRYFAQQHLVLQMGGCTMKNSFLNSRIAGYTAIPNGGTWNDKFLSHIWVTDGQ